MKIGWVNLTLEIYGEGTPNLISGIILDELFSRIPGFEQIPQKMIEVSPGTLTDEHISLAFQALSLAKI